MSRRTVRFVYTFFRLSLTAIAIESKQNRKDIKI